jgi:hypothetical protein
MPDYELAPTVGISDADQRLLQSVLQDLYDRTGDLLPQQLVEEAQPEDAPLHRFFNWDDSDAARRYRLGQATRLIKKVRVKRVDDTSSPPKAVPEYFKVQKEDGRKYAHVSEVMTDADFRRSVVQAAWLRLMAWRREYSNLSELAAIHDAIDQASSQIERAAAAGARRRGRGGARSSPGRRRR